MPNYDIHSDTPFKFLVVLGKMTRALEEQLHQHFEAFGLTKTEFAVLDALATHEKLAIQKIGEIVLISSGGITHVVGGLIKKGLVVKEQCTVDKRKFYARLSEEGRLFWEDYLPHHSAFIESLFNEFDQEQLTQLIQLMKHLGRHIIKQS